MDLQRRRHPKRPSPSSSFTRTKTPYQSEIKSNSEDKTKKPNSEDEIPNLFREDEIEQRNQIQNEIKVKTKSNRRLSDKNEIEASQNEIKIEIENFFCRDFAVMNPKLKLVCFRDSVLHESESEIRDFDLL